MSPTAFKNVFQSLKRNESRQQVTSLFLMNQAVNGDKDSIMNLCDDLSVWLPERKSGKSKLAEFKAKVLTNKLVKGPGKSGGR